MTLVKCPRCELNYITPDQKYCKICLREMKGDSGSEEVELCSVCNEAPALPGKDVCLFCLKEMNKSNSDDTAPETSEGVDASSIGDMDDVTSMDEIIPDEEENIPGQEYGEIEEELSLEEVREDEERVYWHVVQENVHAVMDTMIICEKKDMLLVNYEAPDGSKRHNRLWNGGNGFGVVKLYERTHDGLLLIDEIEATHVGCEYGEYDTE